MLNRVVERDLLIVGEAINQILKMDNTLSNKKKKFLRCNSD
jgi:hypothetical protein